MERYNRDLHTHSIDEYNEVKDTSSTGRDFSFGLLLGIVVGTVAGLVFAPKSGQALRDDLSDPKAMFEDGKEKLVDSIKQKKAEIEEVNRIKNIDDETLELQKDAIRSEAHDSNVIDMSKL